MKVLHIGPHKTGSTFLQRYVFPHLKNVNYYGDGDIAKCWKRGLQPKPERIAVWSTEAAIGWPYPKPEVPRIEELMVLCQDFGISHLLIVKREFPSWVRSIWFQTLNEGGRESFAQWYASNAAGLEPWRMVFRDLGQAARNSGITIKEISYEKLSKETTTVLTELAEFLNSECSQCIEADRRANASKYGAAFISTYIFLNAIIRGRVLRKLARFLGVSPRRLMQQSSFGAFIQRNSKREVSMPEALAKLDWVDSQ